MHETMFWKANLAWIPSPAFFPKGCFQTWYLIHMNDNKVKVTVDGMDVWWNPDHPFCKLVRR